MHHADHQLVGHEAALVHEGLGAQARAAVRRDLLAQQVARRHVHQPKLPRARAPLPRCFQHWPGGRARECQPADALVPAAAPPCTCARVQTGAPRSIALLATVLCVSVDECGPPAGAGSRPGGSPAAALQVSPPAFQSSLCQAACTAPQASSPRLPHRQRSPAPRRRVYKGSNKRSFLTLVHDTLQHHGRPHCLPPVTHRSGQTFLLHNLGAPFQRCAGTACPCQRPARRLS